MRLRRMAAQLTLCILLLIPPAVGFSAEEQPGEQAVVAGKTGTAICGHLGEMSAAREALESGDRGLALRHLRAARAILVECERRAAETGPREVEIGQGPAKLI